VVAPPVIAALNPPTPVMPLIALIGPVVVVLLTLVRRS